MSIPLHCSKPSLEYTRAASSDSVCRWAKLGALFEAADHEPARKRGRDAPPSGGGEHPDPPEIEGSTGLARAPGAVTCRHGLAVELREGDLDLA